MVRSFVNREIELDLLHTEWQKKDARLIVVYGRRRIGKTRLLMEFTKELPGMFYFARDSALVPQLFTFKQQLAAFTEDNLLVDLDLTNWDQLFNYFCRNLPSGRFYLWIDEFSYLIKTDSSIIGTLQRVWDTVLSSSEVFLILSGSLLGMMHEKVLAASSPLYGRRSRDILLPPLNFIHSRKFTSLPFRSSVQLFLAIGGIPEYLHKASEYDTFDVFVQSEFLSRYGYYYREPYYILSQEFRDIKTYFSILNALATGNTQPTQIANFVGIATRQIYPYLDNLIRIGLIRKLIPMFHSPRRSFYQISDPMIDFWFNTTYEYRDQIERNGVIKIDPNVLFTYFGKKFEDFVRKEIIHRLDAFSNESSSLKIGTWWSKDQEIDIVVRHEKQLHLYECKWGQLSEPACRTLLTKLEFKAKSINWSNGSKEFGVFASSISGKNALKKEGYNVYDLNDLERILEEVK